MWCDENISEFTDSGMRAKLESLYQIKFSDEYIIPVADIMSCLRTKREGVSRNDEKYYGFIDWCVANEHGFLSKLDEVWLVDDTIDDGENNDFSFKVVFRNPVVVKSFI